MKTKKQLREEAKAQLRVLNQVEFKQACHSIHNRVLKQPEWQIAAIIGLTISRGKEIMTSDLIETAWKQGKTVVVPKCDPKTKTLTFRTLNDFGQLEEVFYGLKEPKAEETEEVPKDKIELILVPGLLFNPLGYRIGFGGGYYDRFLAGYQGHTMALSLDELIYDELPIEAYDIPVQKIITPQQVIKC